MSSQVMSRRSSAEPVFRDPNEVAAREVSIKLLREILEYQRRLQRLLEHDDSGRTYLVNAYRKAIRLRREMLRDLPLPVDRSEVAPWQD
jgi:hypothetical protein